MLLGNLISGALATVLLVVAGPVPERPRELTWRARIQQQTDKGPDAWVDVTESRPLSFFRTHRPVLGFEPSLEWTSLEDQARVGVRQLGTIDGLAFWEVAQSTTFGESPEEGISSVLLLAGSNEERMLPVHVLNVDRSITVQPMTVVAIGARAAIRLTYVYAGMGRHRADFSYVVHEGRPVDLEIGEALLSGDLPPGVAEDWERFVPRHHRWRAPEWESHPSFEPSTLRGHLFLTTKARDRFCWFETTYRIVEGRLRLRGAELVSCPACNEWCRAGEPWAE